MKIVNTQTEPIFQIQRGSCFLRPSLHCKQSSITHFHSFSIIYERYHNSQFSQHDFQPEGNQMDRIFLCRIIKERRKFCFHFPCQPAYLFMPRINSFLLICFYEIQLPTQAHGGYLLLSRCSNHEQVVFCFTRFHRLSELEQHVRL